MVDIRQGEPVGVSIKGAAMILFSAALSATIGL
jgi:hypothetical protein